MSTELLEEENVKLENIYCKHKKNPWPESASEPYQLSDEVRANFCG
jgi:hypothetical protein